MSPSLSRQPSPEEARIAELEASKEAMRATITSQTTIINLDTSRIVELEAERDKWEWIARHEWRCPLGEMNPGEPGSYTVKRNVDALRARAEEGSGS